MTFDMQKARQICENIRLDENGELDALDQYAMAGAELIRPALDEIERLQAENDRLRTPNASDCWGNPLVIGVSGSCEDAQAKRIAELEKALIDLAGRHPRVRHDEIWRAGRELVRRARR
jgi:hypothetical protein